jgi:hypothetical protein
MDFEFMHVSNGSKFEDLDAVPLARKVKVTLSPFPLFAGSFFFTPSSLGEEIFPDPLALEVVLTKEMPGTL